MADYKFISLDYDEQEPDGLHNCFVIKGDNWNDHQHHVRFDLSYYDGGGQHSYIGKVKILRRLPYGTTKVVEHATRLPKEFGEDIGESFISLGQNEDYYRELGAQFGIADALDILRSLRDIAEMPGLALPFETSTAFRNGMMRENSARRARRFGRAWVRGIIAKAKPNFSYRCKLGASEIPMLSEFEFAPADKLPSRIAAIIGRNAVGKTVFLANLAADLAQIDRVSEHRLTERRERFPGEPPLFARVIAISYSAFDQFRRPDQTPYSSYIYAGIRDENGRIAQRTLLKSFNQNRRRIKEHGREQHWINHILKILGESHGVDERRLFDEIRSEDSTQLLDELSSGQAILCHFVTALLAWIEPESIILFDEPETHLHPNAVANLFLALTDILSDFDSYAIVATHSPVVLQEIPAKRVIHFIRDGATTRAEPLGVESFGESVTELTRHVFKTFEVPSLYKEVLANLAYTMKPEEVLALFPKGLSMAAQAYLLGQYGEKSGR